MARGGRALGQRAFVPRAIQEDEDWATREDDWRDQALCAQADPETWFPAKGASWQAKAAKDLCQICPVKQQCLTAALTQDERFGVWGGTTERARRDLHKLVNHGADPEDVATAHLYGQEVARRWAG